MGNVRVWERSRLDAVTKETEANRKQSVGEFPAFSAQLRIVSVILVAQPPTAEATSQNHSRHDSLTINPTERVISERPAIPRHEQSRKSVPSPSPLDWELMVALQNHSFSSKSVKAAFTLSY